MSAIAGYYIARAVNKFGDDDRLQGWLSICVAVCLLSAVALELSMAMAGVKPWIRMLRSLFRLDNYRC